MDTPLRPRLAFALLLAAAVAILGTAFAFQFIGGLAPCVLCLWQRYPYAIVIGLAGTGFGLTRMAGQSAAVLAVLMFLIALAMVIDAGIAAFHVGVEQHWWRGTSGCTGTTGAATTAAELARQLKATPVVRCDEVAWSLAGISIAGYNFVAALGMAAFAACNGRALLCNRN
jgi:disulfide bond formation protein DsbB